MPLLDQDLPARAQQGDENALAALIARMMPAIRKGAAECTAPGLDFDDAVQEGLIGLFHAVRGFDPAAGQTFTAYAAACIRHAQQDARRAALRKKHAPLHRRIIKNIVCHIERTAILVILLLIFICAQNYR